jgi:hypothetical protein
MPCTPIKGDGFTGIVCSSGSRRPKKCAYCGAPSNRLCDFPLTGPKAGQTCDVPMCYRCTWSPRVEKDYCRPHRATVGAEMAERKATT